MIRFFCPTCRAKVQAPPEHAGRSGRCPKCQGTFVVPAASAAELAESIGSLGNDIPATPLPQSTRPASPFDVFGDGQAPTQAPPPLPAPVAEQAAPPQAAQRKINDREEWEEPPEDEVTQVSYQPPPRPKVSTGWLPLALAGAGGLLILFTIIVGVMGRKSSSSVAVDSKGNPLPQQPTATAPKPKAETSRFNEIQTTLPTTEQGVEAPIRNPLVINPKVSGEKQPVFDPPAQIKSPTTRPVVAAKQWKTAPSLTTPVLVNDSLYVAARDGSFYSIKIDTLQMSELPKLNEPVQRLIRDGTKLKAETLQPTPQMAIDFGTSIDSIDPQDMDPSGTAVKINGKSLPAKFRQHLTGEKQIIFHQDKLWRPATGGTVKVLENGKVTEYTSSVPGIGLWKIALLPQGPLGFDNTSVYALDEHLVPTKRLINLEAEAGKYSQVRINSFLASNEKTLCFVSAYQNKARMMIWSPHGSKKFREASVTYNEMAGTEGNRLALLGDGYLFCGGEITWLPIAGGVPLRFTTAAPVAAAAAQPSLQARRRSAMTIAPSTGKIQNFTPPVITADKIFVGHGAGNMYAFETSIFTTGEKDGSRSAEANP